ncbi:substrate-binding periplasmic protein [Agarilytica rhodophyticola]|uniref:substrate-binding periplasmic protein n=1 Tax=Agarilytica rhodophyticola TaxID=1737490 RepID=UPI000B342B36|nr:transporter substrate-binding domain-containing protein [Agarilytica rhodophyticola]
MYLIVLRLLLLSSVFFCYSSSGKELDSQQDIPYDIKEIIDRGTLKVAVYSKDTEPYYYVNNNGKFTGIDIELIKGFASLLNVDVVFDRSANSLDDVIEKVSSKQVDLAICKLSITFSRASKVSFSKPYLRLYQGLLVSRLALSKQQNGRSREETIQNLEGRIGVISNSSYVGYAQQRFKGMEITGFDSWQNVVTAVTDNKIVAAYRDDSEIKKVIRDDPDAAIDLFAVVFLDAIDQKGIAIPWESYHLKFLIDQYITSLDLDLTADRVLFEYDTVLEKIYRNTH